MRCLQRNKSWVSYKTFLGKEQLVKDGLKTGEYRKVYSDLITTQMNISPASGVATLEMFGDVTNYSRVLMTDDMDCQLEENSIVWVNKPIDGPNDYIVVEVSRSLNSIAYALREVKTGG